LEVGKFPAGLLERILAKVDISDPRVVVGPRVGEDTAVLQTGGSLLVAKSDPVTFATDQIGWYAVQVNANDVACTGGTPKWFLATILVPERFTEDEAEAVFDQILEACRSIDVSLVGGHSEVTYGIDRPIIMGTMLGEVEQDRLILTGGAQEGDSIVVTKGIAIEGTALLAREKSSQLLQAGMTQQAIDKAASLLSVPGISVLHDARIACASSRVHSMHDVTEGGLVTGLREVAKASGLGLAIEESSVPILSECQEVCEALGLEPLGLLASGALLITVPTADVPGLLTSLEGEGINGFEIGTMIEAAEGLQMVEFHGETPLPEFSRDELARYMSSGA
jgi:hydrogenase expression/formation protein HypE